MTKYRVHFYESERGWGNDSWSIDYNTEEEARKACLECENEYMNKGTTPDYYIRPSYVGEVDV